MVLPEKSLNMPPTFVILITVDTIYFRPFRRYTQKRHFLEQKPLITDALSLFISFFLHTCRNCIKLH